MLTHAHIRQAADRLYPDTLAHWHHLNDLAEPSGAEWRTSAWVRETLEQAGVACRPAMPNSPSLVATVTGAQAGPTIGFKCDLDALPFGDGYRHACFHAGHTAILVACARMVAELRAELRGTVHFIFQSSEEVLPSGAELLLDAGAFQVLGIERLIALHATPEFRAGTVAFREGPAQASTDEIHIHVRATRNRGNHIARPHEAVNPIAATASLLVELQKINTQFADPVAPTLLNWARIESNHVRNSANVNQVPTECYLGGNFRTFDQAWREEGKRRIGQICAGVAAMYGDSGLEVELDIRPGVPPVHNDHRLTQNIRNQAVEHLGTAAVLDVPMRMGADDFAFYRVRTGVESCMFRLGTGPAEGGAKGLHHPDFISTVDPECLRVGSGLLAAVALRCEGV
jgi:amidohydrolase